MKNAELWKRVVNEGIGGSATVLRDSEEVVTKRIITSPIIVAPAIHAYDMPGGRTSADWAAYGPVTFPFPMFWLEWPMSVAEPAAREGVLVALDQREDSNDLIGFAFIGIPGQKVNPTCSFRFSLNMEFKVETDDDGKLKRPAIGFLNEGLDRNVCQDFITTYPALVMNTLAYLSCKNVSLAARDNEPAAVRRAIKRHGGNAESYRYHVLIVRPPGAKSDAPAEEIGVMPRHICRGHFSEYGPDFGKGLLFGKYAGRFYIPPHMKGDRKNGIVEKDYEIRSDLAPSSTVATSV